MTNDTILVTYKPMVYLALMLRVHCGWLQSVTQTDGTTSTLKVVLLVVKEKQNMANPQLALKVSAWKWNTSPLLMFLWQNQVALPRLLPMGQG